MLFSECFIILYWNIFLFFSKHCLSWVILVEPSKKVKYSQFADIFAFNFASIYKFWRLWLRSQPDPSLKEKSLKLRFLFAKASKASTTRRQQTQWPVLLDSDLNVIIFIFHNVFVNHSPIFYGLKTFQDVRKNVVVMWCVIYGGERFTKTISRST